MSAGIGGALSGAAGVAAITGSIVQGQRQKAAAKKSERQQEEAQRLATSRAAAELRAQEQNRRRLDKRKPNVAGLLASERQRSLTGAGSTTLTGSTGVGRENLTLGRSSLLGGT